LEQLEELMGRLGGENSIESSVLEKQTVRLLTMVVVLLQQHTVNKRGQCKYCGWTRWKWRFWRRRPRCTVLQASNLAMRQNLDVVWWQLLGSFGRHVSLAEVRRRMGDVY
jgi:hypothetical protein